MRVCVAWKSASLHALAVIGVACWLHLEFLPTCGTCGSFMNIALSTRLPPPPCATDMLLGARHHAQAVATAAQAALDAQHAYSCTLSELVVLSNRQTAEARAVEALKHLVGSTLIHLLFPQAARTTLIISTGVPGREACWQPFACMLTWPAPAQSPCTCSSHHESNVRANMVLACTLNAYA